MKTEKKIGIWGFSRVGSAAARYYLHNGIRPDIFDANPLSPEQQAWCAEHNLRVWQPNALESFLQQQDAIVPSPGIDLRSYHTYAHKWVSEFDLFCNAYQQPIIGITGSIGKTSITHLLSQLLTRVHGSIATGGNIGIGMLDLLTSDTQTALALLELSSFQLELVQTGAPDLAIITNIHPNHLDRHATMSAYMAAKTGIYRHQTNRQKLLMPYDCWQELCAITPPQGKLYLFVTTPTDAAPDLPAGCTGIFFQNTVHQLMYRDETGITMLLDLNALPPITFVQNWLIIVSAAQLLGLELGQLLTYAPSFSLPAHRLELVASVHGVSFYNDSKATTLMSMLAAVAAVSGGKKSVHLFMGGLSKGVDREPTIAQLPETLVHAYCFGAEAATLSALCTKHAIASSTHATLEEAFAHCITQVSPGQVVLLSPGGASYDLFTDYEERGRRFIALVKQQDQHQGKFCR
ncbi:MAG: UDP-N-acetylmuramoyl-L-alanine--D-glutamate ligase [Epsilonproteobacteria bacterium]|nr:UDP-N-acetylmuramoyl-L-alanine--D-glutamate ligase [Campylobacterota bacterium]